MVVVQADREGNSARLMLAGQFDLHHAVTTAREIARHRNVARRLPRCRTGSRRCGRHRSVLRVSPLRQQAIPLTDDPRRAQVTMLLHSRSESGGHRHESKSPAFRNCNVTSPQTALHRRCREGECWAKDLVTASHSENDMSYGSGAEARP